jgi:glycosyltransferase involved in cell wall biosynthesis
MQKTIWLLSAYRSDSHAYWADWLVNDFKDFQWHKVELPGRHFRWRIRGNPLSWLHKLPNNKPDLILATSMVDLATLKGLHPRLVSTPCVYYFHENQFVYPISKAQIDSVEPKMVQLYGALAADKVLFNSKYNRDTFLGGVEKLLNKLPDEIPEGIVERLDAKSSVLPVVVTPVESGKLKNEKLILWNHRWEYDKAPHVFSEALFHLKKINPDFELALLGRRPKVMPDELEKIQSQLSDNIIVNRKVNELEYRHYLGQASIVVSTAIHEFQGLSMLEAVSAGAAPIVPDDLCYREQYASEYRYNAGDSRGLADKIADYLRVVPEVPNVSQWYDDEITDAWHQLLRDF